MRVLVTGGAGFIGSHLVEKLLRDGHDVVILDDFNDFYDPEIKRENIAPVSREVAIHQIDLRDSVAVRSLFRSEKFDTIAHLAARAGVRPSIQQPQLYYDTNVIGTLHLLEAARVTGVQRFVFASSSSVYGIGRTVPPNFFARLTRICTNSAFWRCVILPFTGHGNVPIWPFIDSRDESILGRRSINLVTGPRAAITLT